MKFLIGALAGLLTGLLETVGTIYVTKDELYCFLVVE